MSLDLVRAFPSVHTLNLGGGFKVARMPDEVATDLQEIGQSVKAIFKEFADETGRKLKLEVEPGTFSCRPCLQFGIISPGHHENRTGRLSVHKA